MALTLHSMKPAKGSKTAKMRVGRGLGSRGTTAGRGQKGQKSRSGASGFKLRGIRRLILATPKLRGFKSKYPKASVVNVGDLAKHFKKGEKVTADMIVKKGLVRPSKSGVKILGKGDIDFDLIITGCAVSKSAAEKITKAGGSIK